MRKPRDYDSELKALGDKARQLKERKVQQLGELVAATGADALPIEQLAGALLSAVESKDIAAKEGWLITSLSPGGGEKMSKRTVPAGDVAGLMALLGQIKEKSRLRTGDSYPFVSIQEAGLDGFWIHRMLEREGIDSHVVDPASVTTSRRRRRAKTDRLDGETLLRTLLAYKRGDPRICAMVRPPSPEEEDRRRNCRERRVLIGERVRLVNRIKGLLFCHGIVDFQPLHKDRRERFDALRTADGLPLPRHLSAELGRMLDRVELLLGQMQANEAARDAMIAAAPCPPAPAGGAANLMVLKGVGVRARAVRQPPPRPPAGSSVPRGNQKRCDLWRVRQIPPVRAQLIPAFCLPTPAGQCVMRLKPASAETPQSDSAPRFAA